MYVYNRHKISVRYLSHWIKYQMTSGHGPRKPWTWVGLRPIRTIWFDQPPVGGVQTGQLKRRGASAFSLSLVTLLTLSGTWRDSRWNISFELGLTLGAWLSCLSLLNISGAALVTLPRHRLNQPSIRRRRIEGTTSKYNELNAYGRKESFLWRHAAASTSLVFPPESTRRRTNQPTWFRGQRPEQRIWRKQTTSSLLIFNKQVPLTKSILLIELVKLDLNAVTEHRASVVIFAGQVKRLNS